MIPKIIHYCWFGKAEKNEKTKKCIESWKKYLPEYKIVEWNENNFNVECNEYVKEAYQSRKWAFVSDYVRLYALYNYGGIYMDTDVEILKSLNIFLKDEVFLGLENKGYIQSALIGSIEKHPWIKFLLDDYKNRKFLKKNGEFDFMTNVERISELSSQYFNFDREESYQVLKENVKIYPKDYFCPKSWKTGKIEITKETYAIHHFNGSWKETLEERKIRKMKKRLKKYILLIMIMIIFILFKKFFNL